MEKTAENLIKIAKEQIGYLEKASNSQLDSPKSNAGSANYNKYARDLAAAGYYNGNKQGCAWCDVFVDWCFWTLCGQDKKAAEAMEYQTGTLGAGCKYSAQYYKTAGAYNKTPKLGDQVFFAGLSHTGIVVGLTSTKVTTVEGNADNSVKQNVYDIGSAKIDGYGHPKYVQPAAKVTQSLQAGDTLKLKNVPLYKSAAATAKTSTITGTYYYWGGSVVNGRIRITNTKTRVGIAGQVTGWIDKPDSTTYIVYTVKTGDTLNKIAAEYGTTAVKLGQINGIKNINLIHSGDKLKIPV